MSLAFAAKLLLVPCILALVSWVGRKWGPRVAGWLAGFPVATGPVLLLLAFERGNEFAAQAARASLSAIAAALSFNLAYSWMCTRSGWAPSVAAGLAAWLAAIALAARLPGSPWISLAAVLPAVALAPRLFPRLALQAPRNALPKWELVVRMAAGAGLTLAVTSAAMRIGPTWSGLVTVFPVLGLVLALFSHIGNGPPFAVALLRAMALGFYSFAAFCCALAVLLPGHGIGAAFGMAIAFALGAQTIVVAALQAHARYRARP